MQNLVLARRSKLSESNYVRKADPNNSYWVDFSEAKLSEYINKFSENFNLIIFGDESQEGDFFVIPFGYLKSALTTKSLTKGSNSESKRRWIGSINSNQLRIRNYQGSFDVSSFYGNPELIGFPQLQKIANLLGVSSKTLGNLTKINEEEKNEYAIQNRKAEIKVRQKQSLFRNKVLLNFEQSCCLCGIAESDLLVASHIIPWSHRIESRLDPANGLCLFTLYDQLFDGGYITFSYISFTDEIQVIITPSYRVLSLELQKSLKSIEGKRIRRPVKYRIRHDYLEYHYNVIFSKKAKILGGLVIEENL